MKLLEASKNSEKLDQLVNQLAKFQEKFEVLGGYQMQAEVEKIPVSYTHLTLPTIYSV